MISGFELVTVRQIQCLLKDMTFTSYFFQIKKKYYLKLINYEVLNSGKWKRTILIVSACAKLFKQFYPF